MSYEVCEDNLMIQRFLDEELTPDAAESVHFHAARCASCAERLQNLKTVKAICREQLGLEDEFESEFTQNAVLRVRSRLDIAKSAPPRKDIDSKRKIIAFFECLRSKIASVNFSTKWRIMAGSAALLLVFLGIIAWFAISPSSNISANEILNESELRTAIWENQSDKVLHWVTEIEHVNHSSGLPDGKYRSVRWQNNIGGKSRRLIRHYNENGILVWATWERADGSSVTFKHFPEDEISISPTTRTLREYAASLDERSRQSLEDFAGLSKKNSLIDPGSNIRNKQKLINKWLDKGSVEIIQTPEVGKTFRIQRVFAPSGTEKFIRGEYEADIAADSFIRLRLRTVRYYAGGKSAVEDSHLTFYRESSVEEFDANDLSAEIQQVKRIVYVTPEEVLKIAKRVEQAKKLSQNEAK